MIKITVDSAVYKALQKAFPKPANTAHRALAKYISVLEAMLFQSLHFEVTPMQRKLDLFAISLQTAGQQGWPNRPQKTTRARMASGKQFEFGRGRDHWLQPHR